MYVHISFNHRILAKSQSSSQIKKKSPEWWQTLKQSPAVRKTTLSMEKRNCGFHCNSYLFFLFFLPPLSFSSSFSRPLRRIFENWPSMCPSSKAGSFGVSCEREWNKEHEVETDIKSNSLFTDETKCGSHNSLVGQWWKEELAASIQTTNNKVTADLVEILFFKNFDNEVIGSLFHEVVTIKVLCQWKRIWC